MQIILDIMAYPFLSRAIIVGLLISICSSLLGVSLIVKKYAMIGDGLSHVAFGSLAIASALSMPPMLFAIPTVLIAAFLLLRLNHSNQIKGDSAIAIISTTALAIGVIVSSKASTNIDLSSYMFGSILSVSTDDVNITIILSCIVVILFLLCYHKLFLVTFDEEFAKAIGVKVEHYNLLLSFLTAITIVIGMRIMGTLLMSSLLIFPTLSAMRLTKNYKTTIVVALLIAIIAFMIGFVISYLFVIPTGASVVVVHFIVFVLVSLKRMLF